MRAALLLLAVLVAAGCGGRAPRAVPERPTLPRALAQSWQRQADSVAAALARGDGCTASRLATALRSSVLAAENARRVPAPLLEPLTSGVNALAAQITCAPAPKPPPPPHRHGHGHGKEGD